jgi:predicted TIM-barrel fold metal-dependent hydrolase
MSNAQRIDVHHHFIPPKYLEYLMKTDPHWSGGPPIPDWNIEKARETMAKYGIAQAVGSVVPQVYWGDDAAAIHWARHSNEFAARIVQDDPQHFGAFATLPLPNTAAACRELEYALDTLKLDGVVIFSSNDARYPGDPAFEELFQELERRKAIVLIHPSTIVPGSIVPKLTLPWGLVEFVMDTTRCITNLLYSGTFERYPSIRYIVSHAGGTVPYIAWRIASGVTIMPGAEKQMPKGPLHYLKKLYFDTALSTSDQVMAALDVFAPQSHVLFGSDWPMGTTLGLQLEDEYMSSTPALTESRRRAIDRDNALALFPRFALASDRPALRATA